MWCSPHSWHCGSRHRFPQYGHKNVRLRGTRSGETDCRFQSSDKVRDFIQNGGNGNLGENISGNLFEAFIGALYLDTNYETCEKIVLEKLFTDKHIEKLENKIVSYKGLLLEWSQKKKVTIKYDITEETLPNKNLLFKSCIYLNNVKISSATETSKKKAEEKAAQRAFYSLNKKEHIVEKQKNIS